MFFCTSCWYSLLLFFAVLAIIKLFVRLTLGVCKSNTCLLGKTVLITGGNSGLGFQTALALAGRGARIIIADKDDATESMKTIAKETNNENLVYKHVDLSSLSSIRRFAKEINEEETRLDILINNAGASGLRNEFTEDGLNLNM
ncbi:dehydrogenase, partial [Oryctes borbonicus]